MDPYASRCSTRDRHFSLLPDTILFQLNSARAQAKDMRTPLGMVSREGTPSCSSNWLEGGVNYLKSQDYRFSVAPMMDWNESLVFSNG